MHYQTQYFPSYNNPKKLTSIPPRPLSLSRMRWRCFSSSHVFCSSQISPIWDVVVSFPVGYLNFTTAKRQKSRSRPNTQNGTVAIASNDEEGDDVLDYLKCHECVKVGVPIFHSTGCYTALEQPERQASAGSSLFVPPSKPTPKCSPLIEPIVDPRKEWVQRWNQAVLLLRVVALALDPLFFYALSMSMGKGGAPCLYLDYLVAGVVSLLRSCVDAVHVWHLWMQFRTAYVSRESLVVGRGKLVWDASAIASHYVRSLKRFWLDVFVILPIPQAVFWSLVPKLIKAEKIQLALAILLLTFLFQFIPKLCHGFCLISRLQKATGYIFGTIWWGFGLSLISYLLASHVIGGCWYVLATQQVFSCLKARCEQNGICNLSLSCGKDICYQFMSGEGKMGNHCGANFTTISLPPCLDENGPFSYGIYGEALLVVSGNSLAVKILYPMCWGLINLSSVGNNLNPTSEPLEVIFSIFIVLCGLALFTIMVGNIQVFLSILLAKNKKMQLRNRYLEWWMKRRQLPASLRKRVRHFERQMWDILGDEDQINWIEELPEGLRRDIKRYLCLHLIKEVPLFHNLDDLVLDNICDLVKPLIFSKNEKIIREGDPVPRMVFIVRGRVKRCQSMVQGKVATSVIPPGGFVGDELVSWCLRRPFTDRLPASSATFICTRSTEAFGIEAKDIRYITDHFRYRFASERLRRTMRYYSSNWRTWAAVIIQLAWRRYMARKKAPMVPPLVYEGIENRLGRYAAMFMSLRPHDHLE